MSAISVDSNSDNKIKHTKNPVAVAVKFVISASHALSTRKSRGPRCVVSTTRVSSIADLISPNALRLYDRNQIQHAISDLWCCPAADCDYVAVLTVPRSNSKPGTHLLAYAGRFSIRCLVCGISRCGCCGQVWTHGTNIHAHDIACDAYAPKLPATLGDWKRRNPNVKHCPRWYVIIDKNLGCIHMTCRHCWYSYCWSCGEQWSNGHSYLCQRERRGDLVVPTHVPRPDPIISFVLWLGI